MFGKIIYFDKETIKDYKSIITGQRVLEIEEYDVTNDKGINADLKLVSADAKSTKAYKAKIQESDLYECAEFEKMLAGREDYFDFTVSADYDITTVPSRSIVKMDGSLSIPEEFDLLKVIDLVKPWLMNSDEMLDMEETSRMAIQTFLGSAQATKIPLIFECEGSLLCTKLLQNNLLIDYEELTELEDDVTILARITSNVVAKNKAFYDPLKDFIKLNRMMRKSLGERDEGLKPILVDSEYRVIEILAMYR